MAKALDVHNLGKSYRLNSRLIYKLRDFIPTVIGNFLRNHGSKQSQHSDNFWALKEVSFQQEQGEVLGIVGRNGAGKSTLLKIISQVTMPTVGEVFMNGRVGSLLEVGVGFHDELTGRDNIYLSGAILGMKHSEIKKHFDDIIGFAEIDRYLDIPIKRYSTGMRVRLGFSIAANLQQEILLIDEVLAVGDLAFQRRCLEKLRALARSGRTVLLVSHNIMSIRELCDKAIYLKNGKLISQGLVNDVCEKYLRDMTSLADDDLERLREGERSGTLGLAVKFEQIRLQSSFGIVIPYGAPLTYDLLLHASEATENLRVGFSIYDQTNHCIGTSYTNQSLSMIAGQQLSLHMTTNEIRLAPGIYSICFTLRSGDKNSTIQELDRAFLKPGFEISVSEECGPLLWEQNMGSVVLDRVEITVNPPSLHAQSG